jgi:hypothetical protein
MRKSLLVAVLIGLGITALVSFIIANSYLPLTFEDRAFWYEGRMQNASATTEGSTLLVSFNYSNQGYKDLTLERFILYGSNTDVGSGVSGNPPEQNIPGLIVSFNRTTMKNAEDFTFVIHPHDSVFTSITVPNYTQYINGTYVNVKTVGKEIIEGFRGIPIS